MNARIIIEQFVVENNLRVAFRRDECFDRHDETQLCVEIATQNENEHIDVNFDIYFHNIIRNVEYNNDFYDEQQFDAFYALIQNELFELITNENAHK